MTEQSPPDTEQVRAAEVIAALCLATDLRMGFPFEHGFHATLMAMRLGDVLGIDAETAQRTYYACLLVYAGCTTDAVKAAEIFGNPATSTVVPVLYGSTLERAAGLIRALPPPHSTPLVRMVEVARRLPKLAVENTAHQQALCEVAEMLARRLGLPAAIHGLFAFLTERWDGKGGLGRSHGGDIPLSLRIAVVARDAALQRHVRGEVDAIRTIADRAGGAFDPAITGRFVERATDVFAAADAETSAWNQVLDREPHPRLTLHGEAIDAALAAIGDFADLLSPSLAGHSAGLAKLAAAAAELAGLDNHDTTTVRRAALVHDVGRVAVGLDVWEKPGALTSDEREQVRLHPYHTERVLIRSPFLRQLAAVARDHHERLDGSGYHRGVTAASLPPAARLLAAADTFHAMTEPRPHRDALPPDEAARILTGQAKKGWLDADMVTAVVTAAGEPTPAIERPAGLTDREAEVIGLLARGLATKQVARRLGISPKTADTHIQNAYRKTGVSTRAAATLFAMEHGLVASGELPIHSRPARP